MKLLTFALTATMFASPAALPSGPPPSAGFQVSGVVTSSRDGSPVTHCRVSLIAADAANGAARQSGNGVDAPGNPDVRFAGRGQRVRGGERSAGPPDDENSALTDAHGRFAIAVPHAGTWVLSGAARGFREARYEQHEQFSTRLVLSEASPALKVNLVLKPGGSLTGFVLDEAGEAVRAGQVSAQRKQPPATPGGPDRWIPAGVAQTDDRGYYELGNLLEGQYRVSVSARPWWASASASGVGRAYASNPAAGSSSSSSYDPPLDVVFPITWYPGATDERAAALLDVDAGEDRQADFHLQSVPALHLSIPAAEGSAATESRARGAGRAPLLIRQGASSAQFGGNAGQVIGVDRDGNWQLGGLSPGTYQLRVQDGSASGSRQLQVVLASNSPAVVDLSRAVPAVRIAVQLAGAEASALEGLTLTEIASGQIYSDFRRGRNRTRSPRSSDDDAGNAPGLQVPAGDYFVNAALQPGVSLAGFSAVGARISGRVLHIEDGAPVLTIQVQRGQATVAGTAQLAEKPDPGAMILLVPASFGAAGSLREIQRDQAASDGSFLFRNVPAGPYVLLSLSNGWKVNWRDPATLAQYLAHGTPLLASDTGRSQLVLDSVQP